MEFHPRMAALLLAPALFRWFNFAFLWHSIYWGAIFEFVWNRKKRAAALEARAL